MSHLSISTQMEDFVKVIQNAASVSEAHPSRDGTRDHHQWLSGQLPPIEEWLEDELILLYLCTALQTNLQSNLDVVSLNQTYQMQAV